MPIWLQIVLAVLWLGWVAQAVIAWMLAAKFAHFVGRSPKVYDQPYEPPAVVIVPFKGLEANLRDNVRALCTQAYQPYRLICVFESADDPARQLVQEELASVGDEASSHPWTAQTIIAGPAADDQGQKVHNLLAALDHIQPIDDEDVLVFADSDAVPDRDWLGRLITPLNRTDRTAVTTGYRWLIPEPKQGRTKPDFWAHAASILNSSVASFYARHRYRHAWGGSMAMRAQTARRGDLRGKWRGAISDDYQVTALAGDLEMKIHFVPQCLVASAVDYDFGRLMNFARRQYIITKTHVPKLLFGSLLFQGLYVTGCVSAWAALAYAIISGEPWPMVIGPAVALLIVFVFNQLRASARHLSIRRAFGEEMARQLRQTLRMDRWLTPVWAAVHLGIVLSACFGRTIHWRGNSYRILGPQSVQRIPD